MKPSSKTDGPIEVIVGKTKPPVSTSGTRSFTSHTSNVTIRINEPPEASSSSSKTSERRPSEINATSVRSRYYAAIVNRTILSNDIHVLILGEPQDTIEEALEWMLDRTQTLITDILSRHRKQVGLGCCTTCGYATGLRVSDNGVK